MKEAAANRRKRLLSDTKLEKLDVQDGKKHRLFANHVTQVSEAHDQVILFFNQQVEGLARPTTEGSRESIGTMFMCKEGQGGTHAHL